MKFIVPCISEGISDLISSSLIDSKKNSIWKVLILKGTQPFIYAINERTGQVRGVKCVDTQSAFCVL